MTRHTKPDVVDSIRDLKATESGSGLCLDVPKALVEEWLQETDADPTRYEWLQGVED
jgi:hypothetical protein